MIFSCFIQKPEGYIHDSSCFIQDLEYFITFKKNVHVLLHLKNIYSRFFKIFHVPFKIWNDVLLHSV